MARHFRVLSLAAAMLVLSSPSGHAVGFNAEQCRETIRANLCEKDSKADETCRSPEPSIVADVIRVFDLYPRLFQKLMCGLEQITILDHFYASGDTDSSSRISIRKDLAGGRIPLAAWASWKEQLPFSEEFDRYAIDLSKPYITAVHRSDVNGTLMFILTHELAHVLDGLNSLTDRDGARIFGDKWAEEGRVAAVYGKGNGAAPCFYTICPPIAGHDGDALYEQLHASGFISLYAATSRKEDFADFMAFHVMWQFADLRYVVHVPKGRGHDVIGALDSEAMRGQAEYARELLRRTDLETRGRSIPTLLLDVDAPAAPVLRPRVRPLPDLPAPSQP